MKVVILCGGLGTRLREETEFRPKPMIPLGDDAPILWHIMKYYAVHGFKEFVLCLGYKGEVIKDFFYNYHWQKRSSTIKLGDDRIQRIHGNHEEEDWTVTMLDTGANTLTGGRVKRALEYVEDDTFLLTYGDGLIDSNIQESIEYHKKKDALVTLTAVRPPSRFGELDISNGMVGAFKEKPTGESYINGGYFVCSRKLGEYIEGDMTVLEKEPFEQIANEGRLAAFPHDGFWQCMDTYRETTLLSDMWKSGSAPWKKW